MLVWSPGDVISPSGKIVVPAGHHAPDTLYKARKSSCSPCGSATLQAPNRQWRAWASERHLFLRYCCLGISKSCRVGISGRPTAAGASVEDVLWAAGGLHLAAVNHGFLQVLGIALWESRACRGGGAGQGPGPGSRVSASGRLGRRSHQQASRAGDAICKGPSHSWKTHY